MMQRFVLPLLVCVAFLGTLGILLRQHAVRAPDSRPRSQKPVSQRPVAVPARREGGRELQSTVPGASQTGEQANASASASEAAAAPADTVLTSAAPKSTKYPPVLFGFPATSDEAEVAVTVHNLSREPLEVTVSATDPSPGGAQTTVVVNLPGHVTMNLTQAGLIAQHGYELMVESRGYLTRVGVPVP